MYEKSHHFYNMKTFKIVYNSEDFFNLLDTGISFINPELLSSKPFKVDCQQIYMGPCFHVQWMSTTFLYNNSLFHYLNLHKTIFFMFDLVLGL